MCSAASTGRGPPQRCVQRCSCAHAESDEHAPLDFNNHADSRIRRALVGEATDKHTVHYAGAAAAATQRQRDPALVTTATGQRARPLRRERPDALSRRPPSRPWPATHPPAYASGGRWFWEGFLKQVHSVHVLIDLICCAFVLFNASMTFTVSLTPVDVSRTSVNLFSVPTCARS